jgi:outer membrane protein TolC
MLVACASPAIDANLAAAQADVHERAGLDLRWLRSDAARDDARRDVDRLLLQPLQADDAQRVALTASPALQALLFDRAAQSADASQSARIANPVFALERLAGGDGVEITRGLSIALLDLVLLPQRAQRADARQAQLRLQLAADVLRSAADARAAWIAAVAAAQSARSAQQAHEAADLGARLALKLEASGAFSALQRARVQADAGDTLVALAQARRDERATREALVRALGLSDAQAAALRLPAHLPGLPDLPPTIAVDDAALQRARSGRLDLQLARARLAERAREQGLTRVTGAVTGLELGIEKRTQSAAPTDHGVTLSVPLPLFDAGDAARAGAQARTQAALARTAAQAVDAASQLRAAAADVREAHALALALNERLVPLQATIVGENLLRYNGMLASVFDLLADARAQARTVQQAIAAQRDYWLADAALQAATWGIPATSVAIDLEATP